MRRFAFPLALIAAPLSAQSLSIRSDSVFDAVDSYWRHRATIALPSSDSLAITCDIDSRGFAVTRIQVFLAEAWNDNAVSTSTDLGFFSNSTVGSSRMALRWGDSTKDNWSIAFLKQRYVPLTENDPVSVSRLGLGPRSGELANGDSFLRKLLQTRRVAWRYPAATWYRSGVLQLDEADVVAFSRIRTRCLADREALPP